MADKLDVMEEKLIVIFWNQHLLTYTYNHLLPHRPQKHPEKFLLTSVSVRELIYSTTWLNSFFKTHSSVIFPITPITHPKQTSH